MHASMQENPAVVCPQLGGMSDEKGTDIVAPLLGNSFLFASDWSLDDSSPHALLLDGIALSIGRSYERMP